MLSIRDVHVRLTQNSQHGRSPLLQSQGQLVLMAKVELIKDIHVVKWPDGEETANLVDEGTKENIPITSWRRSMIGGVTTVREKD